MRSRLSLTAASDFERVRASGTGGRSDDLRVWVAPSGGRSEGRLGLSIRAPGSGAVERNALKRRLREAWRSLAGFRRADAIVRAGPDAIGKTFHECRVELERALGRAGVNR